MRSQAKYIQCYCIASAAPVTSTIATTPSTVQVVSITATTTLTKIIVGVATITVILIAIILTGNNKHFNITNK